MCLIRKIYGELGKKLKKICFLIILLTLISGCDEYQFNKISNTNSNIPIMTYDKNQELTIIVPKTQNSVSSKGKDSSKEASTIQYSHIKDILYSDNQGNYYLQYFLYWGLNDDSKHYYYENFAVDLRTNKIVELKNVINIKKFHQINHSQYYSDDSYIYTIVDSFATDTYIRILDLNSSKSQIIGNYIKDEKRVYFGDREVIGANAKEFNVFLVQETSDEATLTTELGYDSRHIYYGSSILNYSKLIELEIDEKLKAFLIKKYFRDEKLINIPSSNSDNYYISQGKEYNHVRENLYEDNNGSLYIKSFNEEIPYISEVMINNTKVPINQIIDKKTYHNLGVSRYAQDKKNFYYLKDDLLTVVDTVPCLKEEYQLIQGNLYSNHDGELFIRMINSTNIECPSYTYIFKIWYQDKDRDLSKVIDVDSYQQFNHLNYAKDKNHVYYLKSTLDGGNFYILPNIDPQTFSIVKIKSSEKNYPFIYLAKDKNNLYFDGETLNYSSFKELPISLKEQRQLVIMYYPDKE